jgi:hypothetical protein
VRFALALIFALVAGATSCEQYYNPESCQHHVIGWCGPGEFCELAPLPDNCTDEKGQPKACGSRCAKATDDVPCSKVRQRWPGECDEAKVFVADAGVKD